jgi:hypothetical protein
MTSASAPTDIGVANFHFSLSFRLDRPIAGCELMPHPYLTIKGGNLDNMARSKLLESNPHVFKFQWQRGPKKPACANPDCPRRYSNDPLDWSKFARGGYGLHCAICEKNRVPSKDSCFCSKR